MKWDNAVRNLPFDRINCRELFYVFMLTLNLLNCMGGQFFAAYTNAPYHEENIAALLFSHLLPFCLYACHGTNGY